MNLREATKADRKLAMIVFPVLAAVILLAGVFQFLDGSGNSRSGHADLPLFVISDDCDLSNVRIQTALEDFELFSSNGRSLVRRAGSSVEHGFPVKPDMASELQKSIRVSRLVRPRTALASRHEALGLGAPIDGGNGTLITLPSCDGQAMIIGRKGDNVYSRTPDENQTWRLDIGFPSDDSFTDWLDFTALQIPEERPQSVQASEPGLSEPLIFDGDSDEALPLREALAGLVFRDIRPASDLFDGASPDFSYVARFEDGSEIRLDRFRLDGQSWFRLSGSALPDARYIHDYLFRPDPISENDLYPD